MDSIGSEVDDEINATAEVRTRSYFFLCLLLFVNVAIVVVFMDIINGERY